MRIGLISDIHGNLCALEAVFQHMEQHPVDIVVCLGDVAVLGPQPREVVKLLKAIDPLIVQGNTDAWAVDPHPDVTQNSETAYTNVIELWGAKMLTDQDKRYLASFKLTQLIDLPSGRRLLACHGSPRAVGEAIFAQLRPEKLSEILAGVNSAVIAHGHTHAQGMFYYRGQLLVNPGSVGMPHRDDPLTGDSWYAPWAEYAVIEAGKYDLGVNFYQVNYSIEKLIETAFAAGMPEVGWWVTFWERGLAKGR